MQPIQDMSDIFREEETRLLAEQKEREARPGYAKDNQRARVRGKLELRRLRRNGGIELDHGEEE